MARMHTRKRGRSGSKKPYRVANPAWVESSAEEIREIVLKLAKKGALPSEIGRTLRDQYGVPSAKLATGKKVQKIMAANDIKQELPEDISSLIRKAVVLNTHLQTNKKDLKSKRSQNLVESKIRRLAKYYKRNKIIEQTWEYDIKKAKLLVD